MPIRENVSSAEEMYFGPVTFGRYNKNSLPARGVIGQVPVYHDYGVIAAADRDGLVASVNPASGATLTLRSTVTGMVNAGGVVTLDTPRNVTIYSATDESAKTLTITGTDQYGEAMVETITGPAGNGAQKVSYGLKAFKTISSMVATGDFGTIEVGFGNVIGLPFYLASGDGLIPIRNDRVASPRNVTATITAIGTAQDVAVPSPVGGTITKVIGISAAGNGTASSVVTVSDGTLEHAVLTFTSSYAALTVLEDTTILNKYVAANEAIKLATDGGGDGAGQATVVIEISPAVITAGVTTTPSATTGDIRGTVDYGGSIDGTNAFGVVMFPDRTTKALAFGATQYSV